MIGLFLLKRRPENTQELIDQLRAIQPVPPVQAPPEDMPPSPPAEIGPLPPGDLVTRFGNPPQDVADAIKRNWPESLWRNAAEVSFYESGWRNNAENNTLNIGPCGTRYFLAAINGYAQTEDSIGIFQINICAHGGTREHWMDPEANAAKGYELYRAGGWNPWTITAHRLGLL